MVDIVPIRSFTDNYVWLIFDPKTRLGVVVDPGDANPVQTYLTQRGISLCAILITHHHHDHTGGVATLLKNKPLPVFGPSNSPFDLISHPLGDNQLCKVDAIGMNFEVIATPGHTLDHIAYYNGQHLFCGDTLFLGGCGRLFEGTAGQMMKSLTKLKQLPDTTQIYCAHEYTLSNLVFAQSLEPNNITLQKRLKTTARIRQQDGTTIPATLREEKDTNPFLRVDTETEFANIRAQKDAFKFSEADYLAKVQ